ncbi:ABC transporter permease, partial [Listeria riparia]
MKETIQILKEQVQHFNKITRIARYDQRATYQSHYLGMVWEVLSPTLQVLIYYFVFGIRMNGSQMIEGNVPYIVWMLIGIIPWFFISGIIVSGANSIYANLSLVSRVKFPMSILPSITIFKAMYSYGTMLVILLFLFVCESYLSNHLLDAVFVLFRMHVLLFICGIVIQCDDYDSFPRLSINHWLCHAVNVFPFRCCDGRDSTPGFLTYQSIEVESHRICDRRVPG